MSSAQMKGIIAYKVLECLFCFGTVEMSRTDFILTLLLNKVTLMKSSEEFADNFELDSLPSGSFTPLGLCENFFFFHT
jgi:hypothetical protein